MNDGEHIPRLKGIEGGGVGDWRIAPLHVTYYSVPTLLFTLSLLFTPIRQIHQYCLNLLETFL